jgi:threonine 3-dehydrogenase
MKALVKERPGPGLSLLEVENPRIASPHDVLFKVEYCAICVGETKVYDWNEWAAGDKTLQLPTVIGHEASGVVVEVGSEVKDVKPGDLIVNDPLISCGRCYVCRSGHTNMCINREIYGKRRGAFAEYAVLPDSVICPLPPKLSMEEGALLENFGVAVHAVEVEAHDPGNWAVVIGCGPIAIMAGQTLAAWGVNVIMTDMVAPRLDMARAISGAAAVVDVSRDDPVQVVADLTRGKGADFVLEAAGTQSAWDQAFDMVRTRGTVVTIGTFNGPVSYNPFFKMTRREIKLLSTMSRTWESWRRMNQLIDAGKVNLKPLISDILPMEEFEQGFERVKSYDVQKILLKPGA